MELAFVPSFARPAGSEINYFWQAPTGGQNFFSVTRWKNVVAKKY